MWQVKPLWKLAFNMFSSLDPFIGYLPSVTIPIFGEAQGVIFPVNVLNNNADNRLVWGCYTHGAQNYGMICYQLNNDLTAIIYSSIVT